MSANDPGVFWDEMYDREDYRYGTEPNEWVRECVSVLPEGARVLSIGDGEGRNGVWLATRGFDVTTIDASAVGVRKAKKLAEANGVSIRAYHGRFPADLPDDATGFDAVVLTFIHVPSERRKAFHDAVIARLKPGGLVILEAFDKAQLGRTSGGPQDLDMLFNETLLAEDFADLEVRALETVEAVLSEGPGHTGAAALVRLLAVR